MELEILSPEKTLFSGEADSVTLPGIVGSFTVLPMHAPLISELGSGKIVYRRGVKEESLQTQGGFVEVKSDVVTMCIENTME